MRGHLRATLMGAGLLIACSALLLAALTGARPLIIALVAVWGLGFGAVPVAAQSWMARAMPANLEGGLALFVSALQGSLAAGSAVGGVIYDVKGPGAVLRWPRPSRPPGHCRCWVGWRGHQLSASRLCRPGPRRGQEAPTPPPGAAGGAGNTARRPR